MNYIVYQRAPLNIIHKGKAHHFTYLCTMIAPICFAKHTPLWDFTVEIYMYYSSYRSLVWPLSLNLTIGSFDQNDWNYFDYNLVLTYTD